MNVVVIKDRESFAHPMMDTIKKKIAKKRNGKYANS
jgi:hypothetical protein